MGKSCLDKGEFDLAIGHFTTAIRLKPGLADAHFDRGLAYGKKGDYEKAIANFTEAIRLKPDLADAHFSRGRITT